MKLSLQPYMDLLARSGQIERVKLGKAVMDRGFYVVLGIVVGWAIALVAR